MSHTMTPPNPLHCPFCHGPYGSARAVDDNPRAEPRDGDYTVCGHCGQVSMLVVTTAGMDLRKPSADEVAHFLDAHADHALVAWQLVDARNRQRDSRPEPES